jgi:hypothetical protein
MIKLLDILNENIQYNKPNFEYEWEEANRYPEFQEIGKDEWIKLAKQGYVTKLSKIKDILGNVDLDFDSLDKDKKQRFEKAFQDGTIEMPIAVKFNNKDYDLISGNTRVSGLIKNNIDPDIWVVKL